MGMAYVRPEGDLREALASLQHDIWSHWMRYLRQQGKYLDSGFWLDGDDMDRWVRQMQTHYDMLSDKERDSDREQADKILALLDRPEFLPALQQLVIKLQKKVEPFNLQKELNLLRAEDGIMQVVNEERMLCQVESVREDDFVAHDQGSPTALIYQFDVAHVSEHDRQFLATGAEFWHVSALEDEQYGARKRVVRLIFIPPK